MINSSVQLEEISDDRVSLDMIIEMIKNLPDELIESKGIILSWCINTDEDKIINYLRAQYRAIADWLKYYLLGRSELSLELSYTQKSYYKPLAERSVETYKLAQETYLLSDILQKDKLYPELTLYLIERETCLRAFNNSGITDKPKPIGKDLNYKNTKKMCDTFEKANLQNFSGYETVHTILDLLAHQALEISSITENYEFRNHWYRFLKRVKQCEDRLRRNKNLQVGYLDKNILRMLNGRGKRKK